ncbi:MAG: GLPGLI family protein [Flavobacterium sp.]|jgi:GLPGLI family protein|uniref:GLPGLI family protein n=1 Tax=Flavobacterium sp. TaxID=239 RepID=UPI0025BF175C|nr:GLPGLI family protein [Flavobacterium sp.]MCA1965159.1 GLPGLI family protein [Flavobacterium sp.]
MRKITFILLFFINILFSQTIKVEYDLLIDMNGMLSNPLRHKIELVNSQGKSLVKKFRNNRFETKALNKDGENLMIVKTSSDTVYFYKEFEENKLYSEEKIFTKIFNVKDSLRIFDWDIVNDTVSILGYKCFKAKTKFRGREFEAFFTTDIQMADGPAKYNGLPGLILKVSIINSGAVYSIEATKIVLTQENTKISNPFDEKKCITFSEFKKKYINKMNEMESYNANQGISISKTGLELLFNE